MVEKPLAKIVPDALSGGRRIAERRKQVGLSQAGLAEKVGVSQSAVAEWERGKNTPKLATLKEIVTVLRCRIDELYPELVAQHSDGQLEFIPEIRKLPASDVDDFNAMINMLSSEEGMFIGMCQAVEVLLRDLPEISSLDPYPLYPFLLSYNDRRFGPTLAMRRIEQYAQADTSGAPYYDRVLKQYGRFADQVINMKVAEKTRKND